MRFTFGIILLAVGILGGTRSFPSSDDIIFSEEDSVAITSSTPLTVKAILDKILSPTDTEIQKDAKSVIAQYLVALSLQDAKSKLTKLPSEKSKSSKVINGKMEEVIQAVIQAAKGRSLEDAVLSASEQVVLIPNDEIIEGKDPSGLFPILKRQGPTTSASINISPVEISEPERSTTLFTPREELATPKPTTTVERQKTQVLSQVDKLVENVSKGNITGAVRESLKIASVETVGVLVNGFLNIVLCNPYDRWTGQCVPVWQQTK